MGESSPGVLCFYRTDMSGWWGVFLLFLIPFGPGIPGGVVLGKSVGMPWPVMVALYFVSDCILACVFEPLMLALLAYSKKSPPMARFRDGTKAMVAKIMRGWGSKGGPFALVMFAFGFDPMTARAAARASGHGFISGWAIAIAGDMMYFAMLMVSTLWLSEALHNGVHAVGIMMIVMLFAPMAVQKVMGGGASAGGGGG